MVVIVLTIDLSSELFKELYNVEIIKTYKQSIPNVRFIGKKYGESDRVDGSFGFQWQEWLKNDSFAPIEKAVGGSEACQTLYEDGDACLGYMRYKEGEPFEYWIGMFTPEGTEVPEGYDSIDIKAANCGICWYYGQESEIYAREDQAMNKLKEMNMIIKRDEQGALWFFERYSSKRFVSDGNGYLTLDIGFYVE